MAVTREYIISYDIGTTSVKAILVDREGTLVTSAIDTYPLKYIRSGWVEQDPEDWWQAMRTVTARLLQTCDCSNNSITAMSICAQMCGTIPVDQSGKPLTNCLTWLDTRSAEVAGKITGGLFRILGYGFPVLEWLWHTNGAPSLSGRDSTSKIIWLRENMPGIWERTEKILDVRDWLVYRCCRRFITTPDVAHLSWLMESGKTVKSWSGVLLDRLQLDSSLFPEIVQCNETIGLLHKEAAADLGLCSDIPIVAGAGDVTASSLGAGSIKDRELHLHLGSAAWLCAHVSRQILDPVNALGTLSSAIPDRYLLVAGQQTGTGVLDRFIANYPQLESLQDNLESINTCASRSPPGARNLQFMPWLMGECVPRPVAGNHAGFFGLEAHHTCDDMTRAILEGIALNIKWAHTKVIKYVHHGNLRTMGGGANSPVWCQILADVLGQPVIRLQHPRFACAAGAAMLATTAIGWQESLESAAERVKIAEIIDPIDGNMAYYKEAFEQFLERYRDIRGATTPTDNNIFREIGHQSGLKQPDNSLSI